MGRIIHIETAQRAKSEKAVHQAYDAYLLAKAREEKTHDLDDGIAAGKAWAKFLELFVRNS